MKKYFFGWQNIKWFIREFGEMYSSRKSFFSKKRLESGIAFIIGQWGMIFFLMENHSKMTTSDLKRITIKKDETHFRKKGMDSIE